MKPFITTCADLKKLGAKIEPINDTPQTAEELFGLILHLGKLTVTKRMRNLW